ncbi:12385_t:CDS:2, partial [Acaulospora morrowiae]
MLSGGAAIHVSKQRCVLQDSARATVIVYDQMLSLNFLEQHINILETNLGDCFACLERLGKTDLNRSKDT